jgi:hypothetical protein
MIGSLEGTDLPYEPTALPPVIDRYLRAHASDADGKRDTATAVTAFTADATVRDDGLTYQGIDSVHTWLDAAASEFSWTSEPIDQERIDDNTYVVVNHVTGDFPGGVVDLDYRFGLRDGLIEDLTIAPR